MRVDIDGHAGYYAAGMNKHATVTVHGNAGPGVAENMMSGRVAREGLRLRRRGRLGAWRPAGHSTAMPACAAASRSRARDIVVGGNVGSFSAFMAQAGPLVICGDAGDALGDSLYEAVLYVRGKIRSLGADARIEPMTER